MLKRFNETGKKNTGVVGDFEFQHEPAAFVVSAESARRLAAIGVKGTSSDTGRPVLQGVEVSYEVTETAGVCSGEVVFAATDSYLLLTRTVDVVFDSAWEQSAGHGCILVNGKDLARMLVDAAKAAGPYAQVLVEVGAESVTVSVGAQYSSTVPLIDAQYPDWRKLGGVISADKVKPAPVEMSGWAFNGDYMIRVQLGRGGTASVRGDQPLRQAFASGKNPELKPAIFHTADGYRALLMPVRV